MKGQKKIFQANDNEKRAMIATHVSDKIDFKLKKMSHETRSLYMIEESLYEEDMTIGNIYVLNTGGSKYMKQILIELKEK